MPANILVVEDEPAIQELIAANLLHAGHHVLRANDAEEAALLVRDTLPDVVLLDWMLPGMPGLQFARRLRADERTRDLPIIMLTARSEEHDKIAGLEAGADDYLTKPFHMEELLARLRALLRRQSAHTSAQWRCGPIMLDTRQARVTVDGQALSLTSHEFKVLAVLMQRAGEVVSRAELNEHIYAQDQDRDSNTIEVFIGRLRKKLPPDTIETVRGLGYRLARTE